MRQLLPRARPLALADALGGLAPPDGPWVALGMVGAVDGGAAVDGGSGGLGGQADLSAFRALRALPDVILVGAGTVRAEDYGPPVPRDVAARRARGQDDVPRVAVVTGSASLDPGARLFADPARRALVLTTRSAPAERREGLAAVADVLVVGDDDVAPRAALEALRAQGMTRVLVEGGPSLNARLLADGVVDELFLSLAPSLVGDGPRIVHGDIGGTVDLTLHELRVHGSELLLRYRVLGRR